MTKHIDISIGLYNIDEVIVGDKRNTNNNNNKKYFISVLYEQNCETQSGTL